MAKFKPYFDIDISKKYSPEERRAIASEIIDYIQERTESGKDKNNRNFKPYTKKYKEEKGQSNVDLFFSGDMISEIEMLQNNSGRIRIGYDRDYDGIGKVEGNILGTYGDENKKDKKPRDFLGITQADLNRILKNYPLRDRDERKARIEEIKKANIIAKDILSRSGFDIEDEEEN